MKWLVATASCFCLGVAGFIGLSANNSPPPHNIALGRSLTPQEKDEVEKAKAKVAEDTKRHVAEDRTGEHNRQFIETMRRGLLAEYAENLESSFLSHGQDVHVAISADGKTIFVTGPSAQRTFGYRLLSNQDVRKAFRSRGITRLMWGESAPVNSLPT